MEQLSERDAEEHKTESSHTNLHSLEYIQSAIKYCNIIKIITKPIRSVSSLVFRVAFTLLHVCIDCPSRFVVFCISCTCQYAFASPYTVSRLYRLFRLFCRFLYRQSLPIRHVRDIRKSSRYALEFNVYRFLVNLQVKLTDMLGSKKLQSELGERSSQALLC